MTGLAALVLLAGLVAPGSPGETLQLRIDHAEPGSTIVIDGGVHTGPLMIDKPITLRGIGWPVIDGGGSGSVITVDSPDVTIEGLVIRNSGVSLDRENSGVSSDGSPRLVVRDNRFEEVLFGAFIRTSPGSQVIGNIVGAMDLEPGRRGDGIRLWESPNSLVEGNEIIGGRDTVMWFTDGVVVRDNRIEAGRYGLHFMYSDNALVEANRLTGNSVGMFLMYSRDVVVRDNVMAGSNGPSGYGIGLKDMDGITANGNVVVGNRVGMYFDNSPWSVDKHQWIESNLFAYNDVGLLFQPSVKRNHFSRNAFVDNTEQVGVTGTGTFEGNSWTVNGVGNYWSDFAGYDADGDGVGDVPYRLQDLYSELSDDHPELAFFAQTPAARALDLAAHMFPQFRPRPKVEDDAPLIGQPSIHTAAPPHGPSALPTFTASLLLLGAAITVVAKARPAGRRAA